MYSLATNSKDSTVKIGVKWRLSMTKKLLLMTSDHCFAFKKVGIATTFHLQETGFGY
jgi:hypothetical protein